MPEPLSDHERETTLRVARVMYPHDALPDVPQLEQPQPATN
jgi:hypothetical protein